MALTINHCLPKIVAFATATNLPYQVPRIRFDTDSFVIGVDTFASITLGNLPDQFEDFKMHNDTEMEGIQGGLDIKGTGTFKFHIKDDEGGVHLIKIPNSKYVPDLKVCLLSPHHWAQEAKDQYPVPKGTKTDTNNEALTLIWNQPRHQRTIPYHPLINTPSFRTTPASHTYRAFVALFEAAKAQYHQGEHVLQMPGRLHLDKDYTAEENAHTNILKKPLTESEGATSDNLTVQASNLSSEKRDKEEKQTTRMGPLTFNVNPELEEDKHVYLAAIDNQAKLMRWHYRIGHLAFSNPKQLALNGEIPRHLAKVKPPVCAGCLFGAMTKVPWRGQETSSEVFVATKAGQCVSVDQLISTQVGFIAQLKGTLTKKHYTAATVFIDHYSQLKYIHLMTKRRPWKPNEPLNTSSSSTAYTYSTTTATMDNLQTTPSRTAAVPKGRDSPSVGSTPTSKMALPRKPSGISERVYGSSSSMHANTGLLPSTWPSGLMHLGVLSTFIIPYLFGRMVPQG